MYTLEEVKSYMIGKKIHTHHFLQNLCYWKKHYFLMKRAAKDGYGELVVRPHLINMGDVYELYESGFDVRELKDGRIRIRWY